MIRRFRAALRAAFRDALAGERGSILPLILGYAVLALALVIVAVNATSLGIAQKRLDAVADAAALAGADAFEITADAGAARAVLDAEGVAASAGALVDAWGTTARVVAAGTPDGASARVTVADEWHPVVLSVLVPDGVRLQSTATARTGLTAEP